MSRFQFERIDLAIASLLANQPVASESEHAHDQCQSAAATLRVNLSFFRSCLKKLDVAEMRMLRWMSGTTKLDRIRNERIIEVGEISKKVQESRLKWYGHVLRREEEGNRVMVMEGQGKRSRGRSITTCWRENCQGMKCNTEFNGGVS